LQVTSAAPGRGERKKRRRKARRAGLLQGIAKRSRAYFMSPPTSVNSLLMLVPSAASAPTMKTAIKEAMSAYSIAVAPDRRRPRRGGA
jgi:hypothetical protein